MTEISKDARGKKQRSQENEKAIKPKNGASYIGVFKHHGPPNNSFGKRLRTPTPRFPTRVDLWKLAQLDMNSKRCKNNNNKSSSKEKKEREKK